MKINKNSPPELPSDVHIPFIQSLYDKRSVIVFGMITQMVFACTVAVETDQNFFYWLAAAFAAVGGLRLGDMLLYDRASIAPQFLRQIRKWETRYTVGGTLACVLTGSFYLAAVVIENDFAEQLGLTLAVGSMVSVVGRNFASKRLVALMTLGAVAPVFAGLVYAGNTAHLIVGVLLAPFFLSIVSMANGLRNFLLQAVVGKHDVAQIASKLDAALNNMPQGLLMLDAQGNVVVANHRAAVMFGHTAEQVFIGRKLKTILRYANRGGLFGFLTVSQVESRLLALINSSDDRKFIMHLKDGRYLEFGARRRGDAGGVIIFEDVSERVENEEKIHRMARFDSLSGLPNRTYFRDLARGAVLCSSPDHFVAFMVVDLDDFKTVNDSLGHPTGDELLCRVAERFASQAGEYAAFSRYGGDEFVGIISNFPSRAEAELAAQSLVHSLQGTYHSGGQDLITTTSAGIVIVSVSEVDLDALLIKADLALYESKQRGKGCATIFADAMDERYQRRQRLKKDLKEAIQQGKLNVVYQPIIDAHSMRIVACEALARWEHQEFGPISPGIFIPLAEETGAISDLSRFMLASACRDCMGWGNDIAVSVNLSAFDFRAADVFTMVRDALDASDLSPWRLEVEVTEGAILDDQAATSAVLTELRKLGVKVSLDDFGTGYSSLSYLNNLPLDKVKIDQSFVRQIGVNERSLKLVTGVTQLARELGLSVTVEGVETLEQFELLKANAHIDLVQGFLFGAALSRKGINTLIENVFSLSSRSPSKVANEAGRLMRGKRFG
jgi:diguanylate cyclase (GGDEF)-like protein/PAS domain S-box-containing protein